MAKAAASDAPSPPPGFHKGDSFMFESVDSVPGWADKGWAGFDRGPILNVPTNGIAAQPYATDIAREGDYIFSNGKEGNEARFAVVHMDEVRQKLQEEEDREKPATLKEDAAPHLREGTGTGPGNPPVINPDQGPDYAPAQGDDEPATGHSRRKRT